MATQRRGRPKLKPHRKQKTSVIQQPIRGRLRARVTPAMATQRRGRPKLKPNKTKDASPQGTPGTCLDMPKADAIVVMVNRREQLTQTIAIIGMVT